MIHLTIQLLISLLTALVETLRIALAEANSALRMFCANARSDAEWLDDACIV